jgi:intracellular septation protein
MSETKTDLPADKPKHGWLNFAVDFGPLLIFFLTYKFSDPEGYPIGAIIKGTGVFMVATIIALIVSKWRLGKVSPMLWLSSVLIIGFGGLTIYFHDETFIQIKPTIIYLFFAAVLFAGLLRGKAMLKYLLQAAFDGLSDQGWLKLSRNWAIFFVALAIANEVLRRYFDFDTWLTAKVWGFTAASLLFTMSQIPMLLKNGMSLADKDEALDEYPPAS